MAASIKAQALIIENNKGRKSLELFFFSLGVRVPPNSICDAKKTLRKGRK